MVALKTDVNIQRIGNVDAEVFKVGDILNAFLAVWLNFKLGDFGVKHGFVILHIPFKRVATIGNYISRVKGLRQGGQRKRHDKNKG